MSRRQHQRRAAIAVSTHCTERRKRVSWIAALEPMPAMNPSKREEVLSM